MSCLCEKQLLLGRCQQYWLLGGFALGRFAQPEPVQAQPAES